MTLLDLLGTVVDELDRAGIPHMLSGSLASTYHGEPRATQDIDLVIDPTPASLESFVAHFDRQRFYFGDAANAPTLRSDFNVVETSTGWKVDLIIRKDRAFSRGEFDRRLPAVLGGVPVSMATPEDTVLAKLEWHRLAGGSAVQQRDVVGVLSVTPDLDMDYLRRWARDLGIAEDLEAALEAADRRP